LLIVFYGKNSYLIAMKNLRVERPCPVLLIRMKKNGEDYFCKSCVNKVVDFRGKGELKKDEVSGEDLCGIFDLNQLPAQREMSFKSKSLFYALAFCSFLGFNIQPAFSQDTLKIDIQGQEVKVPDSNEVSVPDSLSYDHEESGESKIRRKQKRRGWFKKKKKYHAVGTPSF
jgi:hypothetical protein